MLSLILALTCLEPLGCQIEWILHSQARKLRRVQSGLGIDGRRRCCCFWDVFELFCVSKRYKMSKCKINTCFSWTHQVGPVSPIFFAWNVKHPFLGLEIAKQAMYLCHPCHPAWNDPETSWSLHDLHRSWKYIARNGNSGGRSRSNHPCLEMFGEVG